MLGYTTLYLSLITIHISDCRQFSDIYISHGSVATCLKRGGIFKYEFVANLPVSLSEKEFWKSVDIWGSHGQEFSVLLFESRRIEWRCCGCQRVHAAASAVFARRGQLWQTRANNVNTPPPIKSVTPRPQQLLLRLLRLLPRLLLLHGPQRSSCRYWDVSHASAVPWV